MKPPPLPTKARSPSPPALPSARPSEQPYEKSKAIREYTYPAPEPVDMHLLASLPSLPLRSRYLVSSFLHGMHRSPLKGQSVEFSEYRGYQQGDEIRHLDWRLLARSDRLYVKTFEQETQMRVYLVLDASGSMAYRSPRARLTKLDFAKTVLAAVAHLAKRQGDPFGCAVVIGGLKNYVKPRSHSAHLLAVLAALETPAAGGETRWAETLDALANLFSRRSLVILASDFYEDETKLRGVLHRLRYDGHDVIGLQVLDPQELDLADDGSGIYFDLEHFGEVTVSSEEIRSSYVAAHTAYRERLARIFQDEGFALMTLRTDQLPTEALGLYLGQREQQ
ncbi:MAG: DUF58 domain-containing protein [Candidatus Methylacidiphilales bacterium]